MSTNDKIATLLLLIAAPFVVVGLAVAVVVTFCTLFPRATDWLTILLGPDQGLPSSTRDQAADRSFTARGSARSGAELQDWRRVR